MVYGIYVCMIRSELLLLLIQFDFSGYHRIVTRDSVSHPIAKFDL